MAFLIAGEPAFVCRDSKQGIAEPLNKRRLLSNERRYI
jgi:hypothetical protein